MVTDQISDLLTRIRNAQMAGHPSVRIPASRKKLRILEVLVEEGFVASVEETEDDEGKPSLKAMLRYDVETLIGLWEEDGVLLPPGSAPVVGKEAIAKQLRQSAEGPELPEVIDNEMDFSDITVAGDWAIESGTFTSTWREPGAQTPSTQKGNILRVLRRQPDGSWKCARAIWNHHTE